jgi:hypothetical protein
MRAANSRLRTASGLSSIFFLQWNVPKKWKIEQGMVSAKLDASVALAASGALPENVNYAVKSSFLLSFLESVPAVSAKLKAPNTADEKFSDVVKSAQQAAVLVLVY